MASLYSYALCQLSDVKENLGIASSNTSSDNLIIRKINAATDMIENFCGRRFKLTTYSNVEYDATNIDQVVLRQRPITALSVFGSRNTSLNEDDWETLDLEQYFIDSAAGVVDLNFTNTGRWNRYRFTYTAGYSTIPADLAEACATIATYLTQNPTGMVGAIRSKQEGQRRIEYYDSGSSSSGGSTSDSLFKQLGIYDVIGRYANMPLNPDK